MKFANFFKFILREELFMDSVTFSLNPNFCYEGSELNREREINFENIIHLS